MPGAKYAPAAIVGLVDRINVLSAGSQESRLKLLFWVVGVGAFCLLLREIFSFFKTYFMRDLSERVDRDVKNAIPLQAGSRTFWNSRYRSLWAWW